jgi:hypothetical protein
MLEYPERFDMTTHLLMSDFTRLSMEWGNDDGEN